ncbi:MAG: hypothetical protein KF826_06810 [Xanthobacteraceae bacterium]|nr:hypothetical protein [Xanthobacteraceae bacterium]MCW5678724.1 hypothetical protein [Xanthobacteraceae bacterium]
MRAGIVAIIFFVAVLALGHYVAAPMFCRGALVIPSLDARALCGADFHLNRQGSVLLYFAAIVVAMFFGLIAAMFSRPRAAKAETKAAKKEDEKKQDKEEAKKEDKPSETLEKLVVATEKAEAEKAAAEKKEPSPSPSPSPSPVPVAHPSAAATPVAATPAAEPAAVTPPAATAAPEPAPTPIVPAPQTASQSAEAAINAALFPAAEPTPEVKPEAVSQSAPSAEPMPEIVSTAEAVSAAEAITGMNAKKNAPNRPFDGTNEELMERFRELKKQEGVTSIAQAQKLLDESTLAALSKGIDPKQHLSQVAHLVLADDPDLKSGVVRGVVVHVAARLKELGVVQKFIPPAKSA